MLVTVDNDVGGLPVEKGKRRARPGLQVRDLVVSDLGTQDLWAGTADVYVKRGTGDGHNLVLHEYLAARLAVSIGIPVPFGEVAHVHDERSAWVSAVVGKRGQMLAPPSAQEAYNAEPHIVAGIAVFDAWIMNQDRTEQNLVWHHSIGAWAIDHEQSFCGSSHTPETTLDGSVMRPHNVHAFRRLGISREHMIPWTNLIHSIGPEVAVRAVAECNRRKLVTQDRGKHYVSFLVSRAKMIHDLVQGAYDLPASTEDFVFPDGSVMSPLPLSNTYSNKIPSKNEGK